MGLAFLTVIVFAPVRNHPFIYYDDPDYVMANPIVQKGLTAEGLVWAFKNIHGERTYWHPLTWLSHELDCELFGVNSGAHHLVNVLFHLLNVLLLFLVMARLTGADWPSAAISALFAIHPLQVDTVAWIAERKNLLSTFFMLLSLLAYVRFVTRPAVLRYAAVFLLFAAALMSKPAVVAFPFLLLLLDYWPLQRIHLGRIAETGKGRDKNFSSFENSTVSLRRAVLEKVPLLILSGASCVITILAHRGLGMIENQMPLSWRLGNAVVSYGRYLGKFFWPHDLALAYPHPGAWPWATVIASAALLFGFTALVLFRFKAQPFLFTGWFWFLGMLVPVIGLVQAGAQSMADRFAYVPLIGLLIIMVWTGKELFARPSAWLFATVGLSLAIVLCAVMASVQLHYWRNGVVLWKHTLGITKNNWVAHQGLGTALIGEGDFEEAKQHLQTAISIKDNALGHSQLAYIYTKQHDTNRAIVELETSVRLDPRWPESRKSLADLLVQTSRFDEALDQYTKLLELPSPSDDVHIRVGILLYRFARAAEAAQHYREALRLNPTNLVALNNLAWILSTSSSDTMRNGSEALPLAERACRLTQSNFPPFLMTLAAAQAECGDYQQAVVTAAKAKADAAAAGNLSAALQYDQLRLQFSAGKAHREQ